LRAGLRTGSRLGSLRGSCTVLFLLGPISAIVTSLGDNCTLPPVGDGASPKWTVL
jgi:hypothetical protein